MENNGASQWVGHEAGFGRSGAAAGVAARPCVSLIATASWALPDELAMCRRLGIESVGLSGAKAASTGWAVAKGLVRDAGIRVEYLAHGIMSDPEGDAAWGRELAVLGKVVAHAADMGAPTILFTVGPSGRLTWEDAADRLVGRMAPLVSHARERGVVLAIENTMPMRADLSFAHTVRDVAALAARLDSGMVVDLYCAWQEPGLMSTLRANLDRVQVVQVSDFRVGTLSVPNRWVPGEGDLPIARLLAETLALGYRGVVDLELLGPAIEAEGPESALSRALEWLGEKLRG